MGGGCVCHNYIRNFFLNSNENIVSLENGQNIIQNKAYKKISNKTSQILFNNLETKKETKEFNKRYSDFHNIYRKKYGKNSNTKNIKNKINNNEEPSTSLNDTSFMNIKYNNNEETNQKIYSNNNSRFFNGSNIFPVISNQKKNETIEEENNIVNKKSNFDLNNNKHKNVMKKIKINQEGNIRKSESNINYNLNEHNFIFINICRKESFMTYKEFDKFEATTPKMVLKKDNIEEMANGKGNLFSHFCQKRMGDKTLVNQKDFKNQILTSSFVPVYDMNKYSEEMLNIINSIRINPEFFIKHIDEIINNNIFKTEEGIYLISQEVDEKIKLMDNYMEMFDKAKSMLKEKVNSQKEVSKLTKIIYNEDLEIILDDTNFLDYYYNGKEYEEDIDENEEDNIKNIPYKLNLIYDYEDICILDEDYEENENKNDSNKLNNNLNIIDFDEEENQKGENENVKNNNNTYKIIISSNDKNSQQKRYKKNKRQKGKKNKNINKILDLNDDKIGNLILHKRKEIKEQYPHNIFKISVIKDIKISILIQFIMEEFYKDNYKCKLKEIIFDPKYRNFAVSWVNEINRNFISISCFA